MLKEDGNTFRCEVCGCWLASEELANHVCPPPKAKWEMWTDGKSFWVSPDGQKHYHLTRQQLCWFIMLPPYPTESSIRRIFTDDESDEDLTVPVMMFFLIIS